MVNTPKEYERLPGRGGRFEGVSFIAGRRKSCSLWLAADHVLAVESAGFTEEYKRFYYRDIQSIIIRKTSSGKAWNWILLVLLLIPLIAALVEISNLTQSPGDDHAIWVGVWGGIALVLAVFLLINWLRGPTCATHLKTAVQLETLPSLNRLRNAEKALGLMRDRIQAAQGTLAPEEAQVQVESFRQGGIEAQPASNPFWRAAAEQPLRRYNGTVHQILFILVITQGIATCAQIFLNSVPLVLLSDLLALCAIAMVVTALIKQHQTDLPDFLRKWTWACAGYFAAEMFISFVVMSVLGDPDEMQNQWLLLKRFAQLQPLEKPWLLGLFAVSALIALGLGAVGLLSLRNFQRQQVASDAPPVVSENQSPPFVS